MSTMSVSINPITPAQRTFTVTGNVIVNAEPKHTLRSVNVHVQFGIGTVPIAASVSGGSWTCTGTAPAGVQPNSVITLNVSANATLDFLIVKGEPGEEDISAST